MLDQIYRINWKKNILNPADPHYYFSAFSSWIPGSEEVFVDVADYKHVGDGPVVFLSGHYEDYTYDICNQTPGILYRRRKAIEGTFEEKLTKTLKNFSKRLKQLSENGDQKSQFDEKKLTLILNDRSTVENNSVTFNQIKEAVGKAIEKALGQKAKEILHTTSHDSRLRLEIEITL